MIATPKELLSQLPPSDRDFAVFEEVVVARGTTREAAAKFRISQTRVCQILDRVWEWNRQTMHGEATEMPPERLQRAAKLLAADRLDHLYAQSLASFEASKRDQGKHRVGASGYESTTTSSSCGDPRWLTAALKVIVAHSQEGIPFGMVARSRALAAMAAEERGLAREDWDPPMDDAEVDVPPEHRAEPESSPVGDCSENREVRHKPAASPATARDASRREGKSSKHLDRRQRRAREKFFAPVQQPITRDFSLAVAQLTLSPDHPGARLEMPERQTA